MDKSPGFRPRFWGLSPVVRPPLPRMPPQERERRLLAREGVLTPWERQWHRAEDWYFEHLARPEDFDALIGEE